MDCKRNGANNFGAGLAETDSWEEGEAAENQTDLLKHEWHHSRGTSARSADCVHNVHNPGAKAPSVADDPDLLHLLHTYYPKSQKGNAPADEPDRVAIGRALDRPKKREPLEDVLKGVAIELWSDVAGCLFIVADEDDARRLSEPRGTVYTAAEFRCVVQIADPAIVREIHEWKRTFNGRLRQ